MRFPILLVPLVYNELVGGLVQARFAAKTQAFGEQPQKPEGPK